MAENEILTLDGPTASRWSHIRQLLSSGTPARDCFRDIRQQFYLALRSARRQWAREGVTLEGLLTTALERPCDLEALVRQTRNQDFARVLLEVARSQAFLSLEQLVLAWLTTVWDSIRDQLLLDLAAGPPPTAFEADVRAMLGRLARQIANNPTRIPPLPPRRRGTDKGDDLDDLLNRPLL